MSAENKIFITPEGEHDYNKKYKQYTFVTYTKDGIKKVYMSIKDVPPFVSILDTNYWKFVKSDVGGGEDSNNSPKIVDLGNDWFTDEIVGSLEVGDIIKVPGSFFGSNIYTVYRTEYDQDLDVVTNYLFQINEGDDEIDFCILHKIDDSWTIEIINEILKGIRVQTSLPTSGGILPNVVYKRGTLANDESITITLATPIDNIFANVYTVTFDTGNWDTTSDRGPSISWGLPGTTHWADGNAPSIEPNTCYEVSIMDDIAVCITAEKYRNLPVEP